MLYQINKTTWLDLPRWKCRREFAELWSAKHTPKQDVELINRLKAQCDEIEREHMASMSRRAEGCRKTGQKLRGRRYNWVHPAAKAVNVYDMDGRYLATYPSTTKAAQDLFDGDSRATRAQMTIIGSACRNTRRHSYRGYQFRFSDGSTKDIEPYVASQPKPLKHVITLTKKQHNK